MTRRVAAPATGLSGVQGWLRGAPGATPFERTSAVRLTLVAGLCAVFCALTPVPANAADAVRVVGLEVDATKDPIAIDQATPRLSWQLDSSRRGVMQTAAQVVVASQKELLEPGRADVWTSPVRRGSEPSLIYGGKPLSSRTQYYWAVRVWDEADVATGWSDAASFETGLLAASDWRAQWIAGPERTGNLTPEQGVADDAQVAADGDFCRPPKGQVDAAGTQVDPNDPAQPATFVWLALEAVTVPRNQGACREVRPAPMLRKAFDVAKPVARARVYSTGLGYNDLTVNGARTSSSVLNPGFTDYEKTVQYTTHDVTNLLQPGGNVVASTLGSGQFDNAVPSLDWGWERAEWRATPRLRLQLEVTYTDGTSETVVSDESWKVSVDGPTRFDNFYLGDTYDARREIPGWDRPGFDASTWETARAVEAPKGAVRAQVQEPISVVAERDPAAVTHPAPGVTIVDTGQVLTGWASIKVNAPAGTAIEVYYGERLAGDIAPTNTNGLVAGQLQTDYYIAKGGGGETWTPRFSYKGFQYIRITGPGGQPLGPDVQVSVDKIHEVRTALRATSRFQSSSALLARIHKNTTWAIQNNTHGVITDTPTLEKNAWTGDAQLTSGTASTLFDTERLYSKLFQDMVDAQTGEGEVTLLAPTNEHYGHAGQTFKADDCCGATPAWDAFWFVIPWEAYLRYGDLRALERTYPSMRSYLDNWIPKWTGKDGDEYEHTLTSGLGDWDPPSGTETVISLASTAYYAHMAKITANAAQALGRSEESAHYEALFAAIREDFNERFLSPDGIYRDAPDSSFTQTAQILPLAFGLAPEDLRKPLADKLAEDIVQRGGNAYVGILGAKFVLPVLFAAGHADVAYRVATQTDFPSWGYWTDTLGWTSLGEYWDSGSRSRNHHMFGAVVQSFYEDVAGIRPVAPGYAEIEFRPEPAEGLESAEASYESVRGKVAAAWRMRAEGFELDVTVPPNATAEVHFPVGDPAEVVEDGAGRRVLASRAPGVSLVGVEGGRVVYRVGSGSYQFRVGREAGAADQFRNTPGGGGQPATSPDTTAATTGCASTAGFASVSASRAGRGVRFGFSQRSKAPVAVDVFRVSVGRRVIRERLVARFTGRKKPFTWNGVANRSDRRSKPVGDGYYFARYRMVGQGEASDVRRLVLRRSRGRFSSRPDYYRRAACDLVKTYKLARPVFGGRRAESLGISYRLTAPGKVTVVVTKGSRTIKRFAARDAAAKRTFRLRLPARGLARGDYRVRLTATTGSTRVVSTLVSRRL